MALTKIFIAGFGGQGVMVIGEMLTYAAMYENKEVTWMPSYGPEMRGGTANCTVCISDDHPIASPVAAKCDVLVAMNGPSLEKFEPMLVPGGKLFINTSIVVEETPRRDDIEIYNVDCLRIAEEAAGLQKAGNIVMLGAVIAKTGVVRMETIDRVFQTFFKGKKERFIPANRTALMAWTG